jgi:hypothetical protein
MNLQVKIFVSDILQIVENFELHVAHRLRPRPAKTSRSIVAKFERHKDRNEILTAAARSAKLKGSGFGVYEQLPKEIGDRRKELWPIFKREQRLGRRVKFTTDKLIVDGRRIYPSTMPRKFHLDTQNQSNNHNSIPYDANRNVLDAVFDQRRSDRNGGNNTA